MTTFCYTFALIAFSSLFHHSMLFKNLNELQKMSCSLCYPTLHKGKGAGGLTIYDTRCRCFAQGGYSGINVTGGGLTYFFGSKIFNSCIFLGWRFNRVFFGSEKSARTFLGLNFCQANSSYAIQAKVPARSERQKGSMYTVLKIAFLGYKSHVFFWV